MADLDPAAAPAPAEEPEAEPDAPRVPEKEEAMHVHRPKPLHGAREILTEIAVVVVGIVIALAGEQTVEALQWRHKVAETEQSMRIELSFDDGAQAFARAAITGCLDDRLKNIIAAVEAERARPEVARLTDAYQPPERTWDRQSWDEAVASDIGDHLGAARLNGWGKVFDLMPGLHDETALEKQDIDLLTAGSEAKGPLSDEQADRTLRAAKALRRVNATMGVISLEMLQWLAPLDAEPPAALQASILSEARRRYGGCIVVPDYRKASGLPPQYAIQDEEAAMTGRK